MIGRVRLSLLSGQEACGTRMTVMGPFLEYRNVSVLCLLASDSHGGILLPQAVGLGRRYQG